MAPAVLIIITEDPRESPRPAEAVRIAAGVGTWKQVDVTLCLCGPAVRTLAEDADDLVDGDLFASCWPIIGKLGRPVYVEAGAPLVEKLGQPAVKFECIHTVQLASLAARSDYVLRF